MIYVREFLKEVLEWVDGGCKNHPIFVKDIGLCQQALRWGLVKHNDRSVMDQLRALLDATGHKSALPFNTNIADYWRESDFMATYDNPRRVEWIRARLAGG